MSGKCWVKGSCIMTNIALIHWYMYAHKNTSETGNRNIAIIKLIFLIWLIHRLL